jgi:acetyl esterase/lipase
MTIQGQPFEEAKPQAEPDGDMAKVLEAFAELDPQPIETLTPEAARAQPTPADAAMAILRRRKVDRVADLAVVTRDIVIPGPAGDIQARLYGPKSLGDGHKVLPVVVYFHGGGWVIADLDTYDSSPRAIARFGNCIVVSCHYRQAPEHPFPAAHEDAFAAYQWVRANAASFDGDPDKVAVMGESAGGNLAINVCIAARDQGVTPPDYQVLVYPVAGADMTTPSYVENAHAKPLNKAMMEWFVTHTFEDPSQARDPRIDLVKADLSNLPDATVICAQIDPLRSEGEALAERLEAAGSEVRHHTFKGVTHEFFGMGLVVKDAALAEMMVAHNLSRAFKSPLVFI